ncbi:MAG: hypothetical protein V4628_13435 [Pseudomonadota bacterium]
MISLLLYINLVTIIALVYLFTSVIVEVGSIEKLEVVGFSVVFAFTHWRLIKRNNNDMKIINHYKNEPREYGEKREKLVVTYFLLSPLVMAIVSVLAIYLHK